MKKILFTLCAAVLVSMTAAAGEVGSYFAIQVIEGNWKVIEDLYTKTFGDTFFFNEKNRTFTVKVSLEKRNKFLEELKKKHHLGTTQNPDAFTLVVFDDEPVLYSIDSSAVNNMPQRLMELQKLLGKNIRGNKNDKIRRRGTELPGIRVALEKSGFDVAIIKGNILIITERKYPREFFVPDELRKQVAAIFAQLRIPCEVKGNRVFCMVTNTQLQRLQHEMLAGGAVHKITIEKDNLIKLLPVPTVRFRVTISFNNRFEYEKCIKKISGTGKFTITDQEFQEHDMGFNLCTLTIRSRKAGAAEIKDEIWRMVRKAGTRTRERDIKIEKF
ncbi:MAG: hypothetical protein IKD44_06265 [Lentisphaeria bacterium]|nr:hypothetical protein [Lentisphaeria bacterium]